MSMIATPQTQWPAISGYMKTLNTLDKAGRYNQTAADISRCRQIKADLIALIEQNGYSVSYRPGRGYLGTLVDEPQTGTNI